MRTVITNTFWTKMLAIAMVLGFGLALSNAAVPWGGTIPKTVPYSGVLEKNGQLSNVRTKFLFSLFDQPSGGTELWSEPIDDVEVTNGRFVVELGEIIAIPDSVFEASSLYIEVTVFEGNIPYKLNGRQRVASVPFALRSEQTKYANRVVDGGNGVPTGSIMPFAGDNSVVPAGWLPCDGGYFDLGDNPGLDSIIGESFGDGGDGPGGVYGTLPDFRGRFLRGWNNGAVRFGNDPEASSRVTSNTGGATGDVIGSFQYDEFKKHNHSMGDSFDIGANDGSGDSGYEPSGTNNPFTTEDAGESPETRPVNVAVNFIIKCGPDDSCVINGGVD